MMRSDLKKAHCGVLPCTVGHIPQLPVSPDGHLDSVSALDIAPVEPARDNVGIEKDSPLDDGAEPCILNLGIEPLEPGIVNPENCELECGAEKPEKAGLDCGAEKPEKYSPLVDGPIAL